MLTPPAPDLTWFTNAKFGIFIHWGIYSVGQYEASWAFFNHGAPGQDPADSLPYEDYMKQRHAFLARRFDPAKWCELFKAAGARYTVLTTKHHDGVALWDTAEGLSTVRDCACQRDLVQPFVEAVRNSGLRLGLYYSHLDWSHPNYPSIRQENGVTHISPGSPSYPFSYPTGPDEPERWADFLRFHGLQLKELCERFSPDLLWFDGDWERSPRQWRFDELRPRLQRWAPGVILNSRIGDQGDYATPEQGIPTVAPQGPWELCLTLNRSWSMALDPSYKSTPELVRTLCECAGMGGNLLLNISPLSDGTICQHQEKILREIGAWMDVNATAIHDTVAGLPLTHFYGPSTLSADRTTLNLFVLDRPWCEIAVKGIRNPIKSVSILGQPGIAPKHRRSGGAVWANIPGVLWIEVPEAACHPLGAVVRVELDGPLDLYSSEGVVVTQN